MTISKKVASYVLNIFEIKIAKFLWIYFAVIIINFSLKKTLIKV